MTVGVTGCAAANPGTPQARETAETFSTAVDDAAFDQACSMLTPPVLEKMQAGDEGSCPVRLAALGLGDAGGVVSSAAYGRTAQVVMERDTVFLTLSGGQWKIMGAGCVSRGERPYACDVEGN